MPKELLERIELLLAESGHEPEPQAPQTAADEHLLELLDELQPFDIAELIPELTEPQRLMLLQLLPHDRAAAALEHLSYDQQYRLLDHLPEATARLVLADLPSDALVDLMGAIHPRQAEALMHLVPDDNKDRIRQLMTYPETTAGGRMTIGYIVVRSFWTAAQVIAHFRKVAHQVEAASYVYVVDGVGQLVGVASIRDILLSPDDLPVSEIAYTKVVSVEATADQEEAARILSQYDFLALPVVNDLGRLVGVITVDDIMDVFEEEATEDIQRLGGTQPLEEPYLATGMFAMFRKRIGWLLVLFVAESFTGTIMRHFEDVLTQVVALAFFIPLLIDTGGNSGSQASTLVIRALAVGEVTMKDFFRIVWREARLSLMLGLVMAVAAFARAAMLGGGPALGLTVATTIALIVVVGSTIGAALPLIGKRLGIDPAVFSAPLITTVADGVGLLIYFQMARMFLNLG